MRRDCTCRAFSPKLTIIFHDFLHQLFDQLLADDPILLARQFCDCLRDRVDDFICFIGIDLV